MKRLVLLLAGLALAPLAPAQAPPRDPDGLLRPDLLDTALRARANLTGQTAATGRIVLIDYALRSDEKRLFLIDLDTGSVRAFRAAHGSGSDRDHDGYAERFSGEPGSLASPLGAFVLAERYQGRHGLSMRLDGLEPDNASARDRAIVVHSEWYAEPEFLAAHSKLGRSSGCVVLAQADLDTLMANVAPGTFLYIGH